MRLLNWNVQWCRGIDARVDPVRIAAYVRDCGADVACFQEIASAYLDLPGSHGEDQPSMLAGALPGYEAVVAWGVDVRGANGSRARFGNLVLSRLPVERVRRHALPWPANADTPSMPRVAVEVIVGTPAGPLRVMTTHLEYYAASHREAQVRRLCQIVEEGSVPRLGTHDPGPFRSDPPVLGALVCGDFNMPPDDPLHRDLIGAGLVDAWSSVTGGAPHPPTFRLYDESGAAPYCCDFVYLTAGLASRVQSVRIDGETRASDHQPVVVDLR